MMMKSLKPLILYHASCADGAGSALAAYQKFGEDAEYRSAHYDSEPLSLDQYADRDVYMIDFSYKRDVIERMAQHCNLRVIDHHHTAEENLRGLPYCTFDMQHSGAVLAWKYFFPETPVPELLLYIEDRDLWRWTLPHGKEVSAALKALGITVDFRRLISVLAEWESDGVDIGSKRKLIADGRVIVQCETAMVTAMVRSAEQVVLAGQPAMSVNASVLFSEVPDRLLRDHPYPMAIGWYWAGERQLYQVSLRSREGFDCSAIARQFGGGGHLRASGFTCAELPWRKK